MLERRLMSGTLQVAVACIKVASQAVATMPSLLFWPLAPFLALCCLVVYWVAVAAFLYSASSIAPQQLQAPSNGPLSLSVSASTWHCSRAPLHPTISCQRGCVRGFGTASCMRSPLQNLHA